MALSAAREEQKKVLKAALRAQKRKTYTGHPDKDRFNHFLRTWFGLKNAHQGRRLQPCRASHGRVRLTIRELEIDFYDTGFTGTIDVFDEIDLGIVDAVRAELGRIYSVLPAEIRIDMQIDGGRGNLEWQLP